MDVVEFFFIIMSMNIIPQNHCNYRDQETEFIKLALLRLSIPILYECIFVDLFRQHLSVVFFNNIIVLLIYVLNNASSYFFFHKLSNSVFNISVPHFHM